MKAYEEDMLRIALGKDVELVDRDAKDLQADIALHYWLMRFGVEKSEEGDFGFSKQGVTSEKWEEKFKEKMSAGIGLMKREELEAVYGIRQGVSLIATLMGFESSEVDTRDILTAAAAYERMTVYLQSDDETKKREFFEQYFPGKNYEMTRDCAVNINEAYKAIILGADRFKPVFPNEEENQG